MSDPYEQSNVGMGMVPCKKGCRCLDCENERIRAEHDALKYDMTQCYERETALVNEHEALLERLRGLPRYEQHDKGLICDVRLPHGTWMRKAVNGHWIRAADLERVLGD